MSTTRGAQERPFVAPQYCDKNWHKISEGRETAFSSSSQQPISFTAANYQAVVNDAAVVVSHRSEENVMLCFELSKDSTLKRGLLVTLDPEPHIALGSGDKKVVLPLGNSLADLVVNDDDAVWWADIVTNGRGRKALVQWRNSDDTEAERAKINWTAKGIANRRVANQSADSAVSEEEILTEVAAELEERHRCALVKLDASVLPGHPDKLELTSCSFREALIEGQVIRQYNPWVPTGVEEVLVGYHDVEFRDANTEMDSVVSVPVMLLKMTPRASFRVVTTSDIETSELLVHWTGQKLMLRKRKHNWPKVSE